MNTKKSKLIDLDKDLTMKQKSWLTYYFQTGNATQSALKAYDTDDYKTAFVIGAENLVKLRQPVRAYLESKGISIGRLSEILEDGLKANRIISAVSQKDATGATTNSIEVPDHLVRHKFLVTAAEWLGIASEQSKFMQQIIIEFLNS